MKRIFCLSLAVVLALGLFACVRGFRLALYLPDQAAIDAGGYGFITKYVRVDDQNPARLVELLVKHDVLPAGCALLSFEQDGMLWLDMNAAFAEALSQTGTLGETLLLGCLVNTFLTFYGRDGIVIKAEGKTLETGHEIYDYPLGFYLNEK